jgi:dTDP-4-amino-4,6-dideoxygalactose transaminase
MAADVGPGDVCVVPAITFLATATAGRWLGAEVRFADVDADTGLMTPETLGRVLADEPRRVAAVLPVHLGGRMANLGAIRALASERGALVVEDAAHALGSADARGRAGDNGRSDFACFSLHPVKTIAAGEGGMVTTGDAAAAGRMRRLANQGVTRDAMGDRALSFDRDGRPNPWSYEQTELGLNARMDEMSAALGRSQLGKLAWFKARRAALAERYDRDLTRWRRWSGPSWLGSGSRPACICTRCWWTGRRRASTGRRPCEPWRRRASERRSTMRRCTVSPTSKPGMARCVWPAPRRSTRACSPCHCFRPWRTAMWIA